MQPILEWVGQYGSSILAIVAMLAVLVVSVKQKSGGQMDKALAEIERLLNKLLEYADPEDYKRIVRRVAEETWDRYFEGMLGWLVTKEWFVEFVAAWWDDQFSQSLKVANVLYYEKLVRRLGK